MQRIDLYKLKMCSEELKSIKKEMAGIMFELMDADDNVRVTGTETDEQIKRKARKANGDFFSSYIMMSGLQYGLDKIIDEYERTERINATMDKGRGIFPIPKVVRFEYLDNFLNDFNII